MNRWLVASLIRHPIPFQAASGKTGMFREDLLSASIVFRLYFQYAEGVPLHNDSTIPCASTALSHQITLRIDGKFHQIHPAGGRRSVWLLMRPAWNSRGVIRKTAPINDPKNKKKARYGIADNLIRFCFFIQFPFLATTFFPGSA